MSKSLWEIGTDLVRVEELLDAWEEGMELDEETQQKVARFLDARDDQQKEKLTNYAYLIRKLEAEAEACKAEEASWRSKARTREASVRWLKQMAKEHMERTGQQVIETGLFTFRVQNNGGKRPVEVYDMAEVPEDFYEVPTPTISLQRIRDAIDAGATVPGARLGERGTQLRIR